jgi:sugar lactone lactonase YvrE
MLNPLRVTLAKAIVTEVMVILVLWLGVVGMAQTIDTVAGNGSPGFSGDGGLATSPQLFEPVAVAFDDAGNLFIADRSNQRIRKIDTSGIITTVAGNGTRGFSGDGGLAIQAKLNNPSSLATDSAGNLFISDSDNQRIRKVDTSGIITTVAGNGSYGFSGDGDAAITAQLAYPAGITVDNAGNLFIADAVNDRIRKVDTSGIITTVAGSNLAGFGGDGDSAVEARLNSPADVAVDGAGNLFIADTWNSRIRKVDTSGIITTVAGDGSFGFGGDGSSATTAQLQRPASITVDDIGNVFIADTINNRIRKVDTNGTITTVAGKGTRGFWGDGGTAIRAELNFPGSIALDGTGNLFIADYLNHRIRKVDVNGIITTVAGNGAYGFSGDGNPAAGAQLNMPMGVAVDRAGNLFIAGNNNRVRKVDPSGIITTVAGSGPTGSTNDGFRGDGGPATNARLNSVQGIAVDDAGNLFIADTWNSRIRKVDTSGIITTVAGDGTWGFGGDGGLAATAQLNGPTDVEVDSRGNLFIADNANLRIRKVDTSGIITTVAGGGSAGLGDGGLATDAQFNGAFGITIDRLGNLFIADGNRIRKVDVSGIITTVAGTGVPGFEGDGGPATNAQLDYPFGLAVDSGGNLFIAEAANHRIRKVDPNGIITTVAGTGAFGFRGDGRAATSAQLRSPFDVTIDRSGNLYIADFSNHRIRMVEGIATVTAPGNNPVINPDPDIQVRNGDSTADASITAGSVVNIGTFKRDETATVNFLIRNPGGQVLELGELSLPSFLSNIGEPLPEALTSFDSALLTLEVNTSAAGMLEGEVSLVTNDPDAFENPFVFTIAGTVSDETVNTLNILPGVALGDINTRAGQEDVVLLSFKLVMSESSVPVTIDSLTLAASNTGIQRAESLKLYIDGGTRGELDNRDVFLSSTDDTETLTFNFDARTFQPTVPMWFIVVGDF